MSSPSGPSFTLPKSFRPFDPGGDFRNYDRNLPHWRQPGVSYFITFRLHDSLPPTFLYQMKRDYVIWQERLRHESELHQGVVPDDTLAEHESWQLRNWRRTETLMDESHGSCLLRNPSLREIVVGSLRHFDRQRYDIHGLVVMPNHVHLSVMPRVGWEMEHLLQSWKGFTSREIAKQTESPGQLWQHDNWNRIIRDEAHWHRVMRYIVRNPVKAGLTDRETSVWILPDCYSDEGVSSNDSGRVSEEERVYGSEVDEVW